MQKGRQSAIAMKKAFQDKQDTEILLQMEQMLKGVYHAEGLIFKLWKELYKMYVEKV